VQRTQRASTLVSAFAKLFIPIGHLSNAAFSYLNERDRALNSKYEGENVNFHFDVRCIPALSLCSLWGSNQSAGIQRTPNASRHSIAALLRCVLCG